MTIMAKIRIKTKRGDVVEKVVREGQAFSKDWNNSGYFAGPTVILIKAPEGPLLVPFNITSRPHDACQFDGKPQMFHMITPASEYMEILEYWEEKDAR
jgi:hypothetical protein